MRLRSTGWLGTWREWWKVGEFQSPPPSSGELESRAQGGCLGGLWAFRQRWGHEQRVWMLSPHIWKTHLWETDAVIWSGPVGRQLKVIFYFHKEFTHSERCPRMDVAAWFGSELSIRSSVQVRARKPLGEAGLGNSQIWIRGHSKVFYLWDSLTHGEKANGTYLPLQSHW